MNRAVISLIAALAGGAVCAILVLITYWFADHGSRSGFLVFLFLLGWGLLYITYPKDWKDDGGAA